jgi:hypothetical protein
VKTRDCGLILGNLRGYLENLPREGVSADLGRTIANKRPRLDLSASARGQVSEADRRDRGVSDLRVRQTDRPALAAEHERGLGSERQDLNRTVEIGLGLIEA